MKRITTNKKNRKTNHNNKFSKESRLNFTLNEKRQSSIKKENDEKHLNLEQNSVDTKMLKSQTKSNSDEHRKKIAIRFTIVFMVK